MKVSVRTLTGRLIVPILLLVAMAAVPRAAAAAQPGTPPSDVTVGQPPASAQSAPERATAQEGAGGEANLKVPDLSTVAFRGVNGRTLLMSGLVICALGLLFGLMVFTQTKNLPVHPSMREVSELIYETC